MEDDSEKQLIKHNLFITIYSISFTLGYFPLILSQMYLTVQVTYGEIPFWQKEVFYTDEIRVIKYTYSIIL